MTEYWQPAGRIDHDGVDQPPDLADVSAWALVPLALLMLPLVSLWFLTEECWDALRRRCCSRCRMPR